MVEGPGCTRNGHTCRPLVGQSVVGVAGVAAAALAPLVRGRQLVEVFTLGKQLWLCFAGPDTGNGVSAIRCHFGMNGSLRSESTSQNSSNATHGRFTAPTLLICFTSGQRIRVHDASVTAADADLARSSMLAARHRDVCSPQFDEHAATAALLAAAAATTGELMISDALLNQDILPGCGNIIKNEALHQVAIDPRTPVHALSRVQVERLVEAVRTFSLAWLRSGRHPTCKIYNLAKCSDCSGSVTLCKLGRDGTPRPTFWCAARVASGSCGQRMAEQQPAEKSRKRRRDTELTDPWQIAARAALGASPIETVERQGMIPKGTNDAREPPSLPPARPTHTCKLHGPKQIRLRRVKKAGSNCSRLFFSCSVNSCTDFLWADTSFPRCRCSSSPLAGLRISKTASSGGRWFFGCRGDPKSQCGFFLWAQPSVLESLGSLLSPLT